MPKIFKKRSYCKDWTSGEHTKLLELDGSDRMNSMRGGLLHLRLREWEPLSEVDRVEVGLLEYLEDCWAKYIKVTRNSIFRKLLELDKNFPGGVGLFNHITKLKKWFYYVLKWRAKLNIGKIVIVGHKIPPNWKENLNNMHGRIRTVQRP